MTHIRSISHTIAPPPLLQVHEICHLASAGRLIGSYDV
jgi:hypothetical protein